jgi:aspartate-semialdehyde dehydrogenase
MEAVVSQEDGEPVVISALDEENLLGARAVFLAGTRGSSRKAYELLAAHEPAPVIVDLSRGLEDHAGARLRSPLAETPGAPPSAAIHVIAHPAASVLALFLGRLAARYRILRAVAQIFEPVSERGQRGIDELQQQTVSLLSFRKLPSEVFDVQAGFNLLPRYGDGAAEKLEDIEAGIERHLATLLMSGPAPMPSLRLAHAPVFHGYSMSVWAQFDGRPGIRPLAEALACAQIDVRREDQEAPSNVGVAGQSGFTVGAIESDRNDPQAAWFWIAADNLRVVAEDAAAVARQLLAGEAA